MYKNVTNERSSHPSFAQIEALVDFMERNPDLGKGFLKTQGARDRSRRLWEELSVRLNSMGGTIKTYKQWTKYWADKKSTLKKKVAAQACARRRTGGGVEDVVELSEMEERILALCGGREFGTGDTHLGIQPFPETTPSSPPSEIQNINHSNLSDIPPLQSSSIEEARDFVILTPRQGDPHSSQTARRLFVNYTSSEDVFATEPSQSILFDLHREPCPSSRQLLRTPSPPPVLSMPINSPSRRGATNNSTRASNDAGSSWSRRALPPRPLLQSATPSVISVAAHNRPSATITSNMDLHREPCPSPPPPTLSHTPTPPSVLSMPIASPSRRGAANNSRIVRTSEQEHDSLSSRIAQLASTPEHLATPALTAATSPLRRSGTATNTSRRAHSSRGAASTSRRTRPTAPPPSQRQTEFSRITERFLRVEEQQLDIQRSNARLWQTLVEKSLDRDRVLADAVAVTGEGLKALAEAVKSNRE